MSKIASTIGERLWDEMKHSMMGSGVEIVGILEANWSKSLRYQLAAAASDPGYALAWYRVATSREADDALRAKARERFKAAAPDNALPHYVEALAQFEADKPLAALIEIREGNRKRVHLSSSPVPENYQLRFPDTESNREADLVGEYVPPVVLRSTAMSNDSMVSMGAVFGLRHLADKSLGTTADEGLAESHGERIARATTVGQMALNVVNHTHTSGLRDGVHVTTGLIVANRAARRLRDLAAQSNNEELLQRTYAYEEARKTFMDKYVASLKQQDFPDGEGLEDFDRVNAILQEDDRMIVELLKSTGLDRFSFEE